MKTLHNRLSGLLVIGFILVVGVTTWFAAVADDDRHADRAKAERDGDFDQSDDRGRAIERLRRLREEIEHHERARRDDKDGHARHEHDGHNHDDDARHEHDGHDHGDHARREHDDHEHDGHHRREHDGHDHDGHARREHDGPGEHDFERRRMEMAVHEMEMELRSRERTMVLHAAEMAEDEFASSVIAVKMIAESEDAESAIESLQDLANEVENAGLRRHIQFQLAELWRRVGHHRESVKVLSDIVRQANLDDDDEDDDEEEYDEDDREEEERRRELDGPDELDDRR